MEQDKDVTPSVRRVVLVINVSVGAVLTKEEAESLSKAIAGWHAEHFPKNHASIVIEGVDIRG